MNIKRNHWEKSTFFLTLENMLFHRSDHEEKITELLKSVPPATRLDHKTAHFLNIIILHDLWNEMGDFFSTLRFPHRDRSSLEYEVICRNLREKGRADLLKKFEEKFSFSVAPI